MDQPFFGHGPNSHEILCNDKRFRNTSTNCSHPHSFYFQLFSEQGLIGLSFLIFLYLNILINFIKNIKNKIKMHIVDKKNFLLEISSFQILILVILFPFLPNMSFYNNWNNVIVFLIIGFWFHFNNLNSK